jgi:hypothetical protein
MANPLSQHETIHIQFDLDLKGTGGSKKPKCVEFASADIGFRLKLTDSQRNVIPTLDIDGLH